jgi:hypothetical protein
MRAALAAPLLSLALIACGPISVEQAERQCLERAQLAQEPQVEVALGVNNRGQVLTGGSFGISTDYLAGRDPSAVFDACVKSQSGQFPTRSFSELSVR